MCCPQAPVCNATTVPTDDQGVKTCACRRRHGAMRRRTPEIPSETEWWCPKNDKILRPPEVCGSHNEVTCPVWTDEPLGLHCVWEGGLCQAKAYCGSFSASGGVCGERAEKSHFELQICEGTTCTVDDCCDQPCSPGFRIAAFRGYWQDAWDQKAPYGRKHGIENIASEHNLVEMCGRECIGTDDCTHYNVCQQEKSCWIYNEMHGPEQLLRKDLHECTACIKAGRWEKFKHVKFTVTHLQNPAMREVHLGELEFSYNGVQLDMSNAVATNPGGSSPANQGPDKAIDGLPDTQWHDQHDVPATLWITFTDEVMADKFRFVTSTSLNDADPVSWVMETSRDGQKWKKQHVVNKFTECVWGVSPWFYIEDGLQENPPPATTARSIDVESIKASSAECSGCDQTVTPGCDPQGPGRLVSACDATVCDTVSGCGGECTVGVLAVNTAQQGLWASKSSSSSLGGGQWLDLDLGRDYAVTKIQLWSGLNFSYFPQEITILSGGSITDGSTNGGIGCFSKNDGIEADSGDWTVVAGPFDIGSGSSLVGCAVAASSDHYNDHDLFKDDKAHFLTEEDNCEVPLSGVSGRYLRIWFHSAADSSHVDVIHLRALKVWGMPQGVTYGIYRGCYDNDGATAMVVDESSDFQECSESAIAEGKHFFGLQDPGHYPSEGVTGCLALDSLPNKMILVDDAQCDVEGEQNDNRLGGRKRLAVYGADACPWLNGQVTDANDKVLCADGEFVTDYECVKGGHGGRLQCPPNKPYMCSWGNACGDHKEHCCEADCEYQGDLRICPQDVNFKTIPTTMDCLEKITCFEELPLSLQANATWLAECIYSPESNPTHQRCSEWTDCLNQKDEEPMIDIFKSLTLAAFGHYGHTDFLLQLNDTKGVKRVEDDANCTDPFNMSVHEIECACWADLKANCMAQVGEQQVLCIKVLMCRSGAVCEDWQDAQCTDDEKHSADYDHFTNLSLADVFQGRRQPPGSTSLFDDDAELEMSLSSKANSKSCR